MNPNNHTMLSDKEIAALLPEYFSGTISEENRLLVDTWRHESNDHQQMFDAVADLYMDFRAFDTIRSIDVEAAMNRVNTRIGISMSINWFRRIERAAAVLILPLIMATAWLAYENWTTEPLYCEMHTQAGMIGRVVLPDSTVVILNAGSTLRYPSEFTGKTREVELIGEGYFDVTKDAKHQFVVSLANGSRVNVYGTRFNIDAYPGDDCVTTLVEGSIGFNYVNNVGAARETIMVPNQQLTLSSSGHVSIYNVDGPNAIAWKDDAIVLDKTSIKQILKALTRRFGVRFQVANPAIEEYTFSGGSMSIKSIENVLESLRISSGIKWRYITSEHDSDAIIEITD